MLRTIFHLVILALFKFFTNPVKATLPAYYLAKGIGYIEQKAEANTIASAFLFDVTG